MNGAIKWGLLDAQGALLLPAAYDYIRRPVTDHSFIVFRGAFEWDEFEEETFNLFHDVIDDRRSWNGDQYLATLGKGAWGLVDNKNELLLPCSYNSLNFYSDSILIANEGGSRIIKWFCGDDKQEAWSVVGGTWKALDRSGATLAEMSNKEQQYDFHSFLGQLQPWDPGYRKQVVDAYFV